MAAAEDVALDQEIMLPAALVVAWPIKTTLPLCRETHTPLLLEAAEHEKATVPEETFMQVLPVEILRFLMA